MTIGRFGPYDTSHKAGSERRGKPRHGCLKDSVKGVAACS